MGCRRCGCYVASPKWQYHFEKPLSFRNFYAQKRYYREGGRTVYWSFACNTCAFLQDLQRFRLDNPQSRDVIERQLAEDMEVFANIFSQDTDCTLAKYRTVCDVPGEKEHKDMNKTMRAQCPWYSSGYGNGCEPFTRPRPRLRMPRPRSRRNSVCRGYGCEAIPTCGGHGCS